MKPLKVSDTIKDGIQAFEDGEAFDDCPYIPEITHVEGFHGTNSIGPVRIGIDWQRAWEIGWNIGELLHIKRSSRKPCLLTKGEKQWPVSD